MSYSFKLCRYFCHFFPLVSKEILKQWWEYRDSKNKECWLRINIQKIRHNDEVNMKKRTSTMTVNFRSCKNKLATLIWQPYLIKCEMWILSLRCEEGKVELLFFPFFFFVLKNWKEELMGGIPPVFLSQGYFVFKKIWKDAL